MPQTGTGTGRARKVLRARLDATWDSTITPIWFPEDEFDVPAYTSSGAPASFLRVEDNAYFEDTASVNGSTEGSGSWSLIFACQPRHGLDAAIEQAESWVRQIADSTNNDDAEDVWTSGAVEVHRNVSPSVPASVQEAFFYTQFAVAFSLMEGFS